MRKFLFPLVLMFCTSVVNAVSLNEIRIDQPSSDNDEYFELKGQALESLANHSYLVIGDGAGGSGTIEAVVDLSAEQLDSNGLFTVAETTFTLAAANLQANINFENSDNVTHLLVTGFTGANGDDLDTDDDGVLDVSPWSAVIDSVGLRENDSGEALYSPTIVGPDSNFVPSHIYRCEEGWRIGGFALGENDTPTQENVCDVVTPPAGPIAATIPQIQSAGDVSPFDGQIIVTTGVVTADFQGGDQLRGFFMQDQLGDNDPLTSDGIFVFDPDGVDVQVGDVVQVTAQVTEFFGFTELNNVSEINVIAINSTASAQITPTVISLPETVDGELERYEGMLVEIAQPMTVAQNFFLGRYGQMTLSSADESGVAGRLFQPTNQFPASSPEAIALAQSNARRILILDDGQDISGFGDNPVPVPYLGFPPQVIRAGDEVSNLVGVLDFGRINSVSTPSRDYRLHPTQAPSFTNINQREVVLTTPVNTNGRLSVASFNVLNYFTTIDGQGSICGPQVNQGCRGADSASELQRQQDKIVSAIQALDADIVGLIEIENNGFGPGSAIQTLVDAVNMAYNGSDVDNVINSETYRVVEVAVNGSPDEALGDDVITVGYIYKPASVSPVGLTATLDTGAFDQTQDDGISRQPLAVSFSEVSTDEVFTVVVNHLKSKRPPSTPQNDGNDDQGDGQGSWNLRRTEAAKQLASWLATNPTGIDDDDILIIGDLNAYGQEDPILALNQAGYIDLVRSFNSETAYSFIFDGQSGYLDHALANDSLASQVTGAIEWHINTDEPQVIDYDQNFNPEGYYNADPFRSSDHDPVVVGLNLFTPSVDVDEDGVADEQDLCLATPIGVLVDAQGCSGKQLVVENCDHLFAGLVAKPAGKRQARKFLRCMLRTVSTAYHQGLLSHHQAIRLYRKSILRVIRHAKKHY